MGDFTQSTDAMVWAEAFQEHKARNQWSIDDIDEGLMVGWFANAMERMSDTLKSEVARLHSEAHERDSEIIGWRNAAELRESEVARLEGEKELLRDISECPPDCDMYSWLKLLASAQESAVENLAEVARLERAIRRWSAPTGAHRDCTCRLCEELRAVLEPHPAARKDE